MELTPQTAKKLKKAAKQVQEIALKGPPPPATEAAKKKSKKKSAPILSSESSSSASEEEEDSQKHKSDSSGKSGLSEEMRKHIKKSINGYSLPSSVQ